jgi:hypothetical protein
MTRAAPLEGAYQADNAYDLKYGERAKRRQVGPSNTYNCHGLTFGARRAGILSDVQIILEDDDYVEVDIKDVLPGDIVIYFSTESSGIAGDAEHSGIVVDRTALGSVKVVSKWGYGDERIHWLKDCEYDVSNIRFFRINDCPKNTERRSFSRGTRLLGG